MAKITLKRNECIGCGACAATCSDLFEMADDGHAHLKGSKKKGDVEELELKDVKCGKEAVEVCPVQIISVK
ncbi:ferredoxin [Candidatus Woesearchaeota archaeon]|nr:ferredoxin [Candidatus Woesearchaeota archaeon]